MKSFTSQRVVKSYAVEVSAPRVLDCQADAFRSLMSRLTVVTVDEDKEVLRAVKNEDVQEWFFSETENVVQGGNRFWSKNGAESEDDPEKQDGAQSVEQAKAAEEATAIIAKARAEAAEIRRQAEEDGAAILAKARAEEESLRLQLEADVRSEVFPQAQQEGYEEGVRAGREEGANLRAEAYALLNLAQTALEAEYVKVDEEILHLSILIAERLARAALTIDPARLVAIVRNLSLLPQERQGWRLHLAAADADWIQRLEPGELPCPWVVDESLNRGDCVLECQEGIFDARVATQLERLEEALREELRRGTVAEAGSDSGE